LRSTAVSLGTNKLADYFQRKDSISNAHVGREFESLAAVVLGKKGVSVETGFPVEVGVSSTRKSHSFDLGSDEPPVVVECKSHRWTSGGNVPSAKMTVWNEAMYYFSCSPDRYRKIFFVLRDAREKSGETLAQYYIRTYAHLIPDAVEIWEYDEATNEVNILYGA